MMPKLTTTVPTTKKMKSRLPVAEARKSGEISTSVEAAVSMVGAKETTDCEPHTRHGPVSVRPNAPIAVRYLLGVLAPDSPVQPPAHPPPAGIPCCFQCALLCALLPVPGLAAG